jgi:nucleotide-binding universal stress UspA family protein
MKTILVPLDGSDFAARALPTAVAIARASGAALRLVRVVPIDPFGAARDVDAFAAEEELGAVASRCRSDGLAVTVHVESGQPADGIVSTAHLGQFDRADASSCPSTAPPSARSRSSRRSSLPGRCPRI